jgi:myo-inositol-1(or 4)-monophosphatase
MAAAALIVREAGGVVVDTSGGDLDLMSRRVLCTSSQKLATTVSRRLVQMTLPRD